MEDSIAAQTNNKKFAEFMAKKTHFTELEVERLLNVFSKALVIYYYLVVL